MNDQHEDIEPEERFDITDDGKLKETEDSSVDFEENLTFDE